MGEKSCIFYALKLKQPHPMTEPKKWLCLSLWLIQDSNWKGRVLWKLFGDLATILQNWISCNEQKMREAHITRRGTNFYLLIFIEKKSSTVKLNTAKKILADPPIPAVLPFPRNTNKKIPAAIGPTRHSAPYPRGNKH